jgi:hypothetical protein
MREDLCARGPKDSPVLIVGDSLPEKETTQGKLLEILDRRGVTYNSIIVPLKYYINEYLIKKYKLKLPSDSNNKEDIFRFVNAINNPDDKRGLDPLNRNYSIVLKNLSNEIFDNNNKTKYRLILCMGDFSYFAVRSLFEKYHPGENKFYKSSGTRFKIGKLGQFFQQGIREYKKGDNILILPILHNSSNLHFQKTNEFIPKDKRNNYISYLNYIAEEVSEIIMNDIEMTKYLIET